MCQQSEALQQGQGGFHGAQDGGRQSFLCLLSHKGDKDSKGCKEDTLTGQPDLILCLGLGGGDRECGKALG
jgi:hypothetical protein